MDGVSDVTFLPFTCPKAFAAAWAVMKFVWAASEASSTEPSTLTVALPPQTLYSSRSGVNHGNLEKLKSVGRSRHSDWSYTHH